MRLRLLIGRVLLSVITLLGASVLIFLAVRVVPGDPVQVLAAEQLPAEIIENQRRLFGLDQPLPTQYLVWILNVVHGEFGVSWRYFRPASNVILERAPATLELAIVAFGIAVALGMTAGIIAATRRGTALDYVISASVLVGQGIPIFWLGIMLVLVFAVDLHWLPTSGRDGPAHLVLPAITLSTWLIPPIARLTRASLLETLSSPYVSTARSKGLTEWMIVTRHALPNALLPVVTLLGVQMGSLLSGALVTEAVFAWPGVGTVMIEAIHTRDYPIVQAGVLISVGIYVFINLIVDLLYAQIDPRIAHA